MSIRAAADGGSEGSCPWPTFNARSTPHSVMSSSIRNMQHGTAQHSTARSDSSSPIPLRACISLDLFPTCTVQQHRANTVTCLLVRCIRLRVHLSVRVLSVHGHPPFCLQTALAFVLQHFFLFFVFGWMKIFHHCSVNSRTRASTWMHETEAAPPTHSVVVVIPKPWYRSSAQQSQYDARRPAWFTILHTPPTTPFSRSHFISHALNICLSVCWLQQSIYHETSNWRLNLVKNQFAKKTGARRSQRKADSISFCDGGAYCTSALTMT